MLGPEADKQKVMYRADVMKLIQRSHVKSKHAMYINDEMTYAGYKQYMFYVVNDIRAIMGYPKYSMAKFDEAWQYRILAHEKWDYARNELFNTIIGWW